MKFAILIPAYNEANSILDVIRIAKSKCRDVIVIVDGATDHTLETVRIEGGTHILHHNGNLGLTEALKTGFKYALGENFDAVLKVDADGQMNLDKFEKILGSYQASQVDIVLAGYDQKTPWMIKKDIQLYSFLYYMATGIYLNDIVSEYRLFSRKAMQIFLNLKIKKNASNFAIIGLLHEGCTVKEIDNSVNYEVTRLRPAYLQLLVDCRIQFVSGLWQIGTLRSRFLALISIPTLIVLLLFNITVGFRYNTILLKKFVRN